MTTVDIRSKPVLAALVRRAASGPVTLTEAGTPVAVVRATGGKTARARRPFGLSRAELARQCRAANRADRRDGWERLVEWPE